MALYTSLKRRGRLLAVSLCLATLPVFAAGSASAAPQALAEDGGNGFQRRILTLPEAKLYQQPAEDGGVVEGNMPAFSIFYVYGEKLINGTKWLEVGKLPEGSGSGWLPKAKTEEWKSMLVMQYAPRGQRERVMFFKDSDDLRDMVESDDRPRRVGELRGGLPGGGRGGAGSGPAVLAVEPEQAVDPTGQPYLMPILDFEFTEFDTGDLGTLVQVGSLNAPMVGNHGGGDAGGSPAGRGGDAGGAADGDPQVQELSGFRTGIVFVIDTTQSMGPYIDRTRETVRGIYQRIEAAGNLDKVAFGVVGYRDYVDYNPGIDYVTKVFQDLSLETPPAALLQNMERIKAASVPTQGWNEDAYAGLYTAINDVNWEPFDARVIVLMSDAGARASNDEHAANRNFGSANVVEEADRKGITIFPIHLRTDEAQRANNLPGTERQFRSMSRTGDVNVDKYVGIDSGALSEFGRFVDDFARQVEVVVTGSANNQMVRRPDLGDPDLPPPPGQGQPPSARETPENEPEEPDTALGSMLVNEVFRAQLEYLGRRNGTQAPSFYRAWAVDRDLSNPAFDALDVGVFLNRTQLNGLAQALEAIVTRAKAADLNPGGFFDMLQSLSATMEHDPNRGGAAGDFENLAESGLLPAYLEALPYHSKVLRLNRQTWLDWGQTGQLEFIIELEDKLTIYDRIYQDTDNWVDLGAGDPGLAVYPVPLRYLP